MKSTTTKITKFVNAIHKKNTTEINLKIAEDIYEINIDELSITINEYNKARQLLETCCDSNVDTSEPINILSSIIDYRNLAQQNTKKAKHEYNICETAAIKARSEYRRLLNILNGE